MTEIGLYDRDGHLLGLTVERLLVGELSERDLSGHLGGCAPCRERVARARAIAPPPLPAALMAAARAAPALSAPAASPPAAPRATAADLWRVFLRWITPAGMVAAVAAAALLSLKTPERAVEDVEDWSCKGCGVMGFSAFIQHGGEVRRLSFGETVSPGDRVGFQVTPAQEGYLMVLGDDALHPPYLVYPRGGAAVPLEPAATTLDVAIELDATPGPERFIAVFCDAPFAFGEVAGAMDAARFDEVAPALRPGCDQEELRLERGERL